MKPQTILEAIKDFNKAYEEFVNVIKEEMYLTTLLHLWNNDLQLWTGHWWWMDL